MSANAYLVGKDELKADWRFGRIPDNAVFAKDGYIGRNVKIYSPIGSPEKPLDYVYLGDNVYIGEGCNIQVPKLVIGDYTKFHRNGLIFGRNPITIGYNCWFGEGTILDAEGHIRIGNGVGAGAYSQLFSHARHGDTLEGCRYLSFGQLTIEDDCWLIGSVRIGPVYAHKKSVAMLGSTITKDMPENTVWGGCPAKDLTDKLGSPFLSRSPQDKIDDFTSRIDEFRRRYPEYKDESFFHFDPVARTYTKTGAASEVALMRFLLPEAKFIPNNETLPEV